MENVIHVRQLSGDLDIELPGAFIYHVAYRADEPDKLLISGQWQTESEVFPFEYDLESGQQHLLECDGRPAYKSAILGDQVLHAQPCRRVGHARDMNSVDSSRMYRGAPLVREPTVSEEGGQCACRPMSTQVCASWTWGCHRPTSA